MSDVIQTGRSNPVYASPPQIALVNNYRTELCDGLPADQRTVVVRETAGLPRLYNDSVLFLTLKRLSDGRTEQVKVTSIAGQALGVERAINGSPLDFYPGDIVYSALTAEVLNHLVSSVRTANIYLCNLLDLSHIPPVSGCDVNPGDEVEYTGLPFPINADEALSYLTAYISILWKHVDCNRAIFDTFKAKDYANLWSVVCDVKASLERLRGRVDDLDSRFTTVECCCDRLESRIDALELCVEDLKERVAELEQCVDDLKNAEDPVIPDTQAQCACGSGDSGDIDIPEGRSVMVFLSIPLVQCGTGGCSVDVTASFNNGVIATVGGDNGSDGSFGPESTQGCAEGPGTLNITSQSSGTGQSGRWAYIIC